MDEQELDILYSQCTRQECKLIDNIMSSTISCIDKKRFISYIFDGKHILIDIKNEVESYLQFIENNELDGKLPIKIIENINDPINDYEIIKWVGIRNDESGKIESGHLYIKKGDRIIGLNIRGVHNRSQAIKEYLINKSKYDKRF